MSPFFAKFVSRFHILNTQESSCAMTPCFVFWVAPELQCFHARHLVPGTLWFHKPNTWETDCNYSCFVLNCSWIAFMPDYLRSSTYQIYAISHTEYLRIWLQSILFCSKLLLNCNAFIHTIWDPVPFKSVCFHIPNAWESDCNWYRFVPSCSSIATNPFCAKFLLNCNAFSHRLSGIQYPIKLPTCKRLDHLSNN